MTFGEYIKLKRKESKISQHTLALACGFTHRAQLSKLEAGKIEWKLSEVYAIAPMLGTTGAGLLSEFESRYMYFEAKKSAHMALSKPSF